MDLHQFSEFRTIVGPPTRLVALWHWHVESTTMLTVAEALAAVLREAKTLPAEGAALSALPIGQILAEAVASDIDSPPFTKALMDGYALRADDVERIPATLRIIEEVAAGKMPSQPVKSGEATRIMTGAPIPQGADAVVMIEKTELSATNQVRILSPAKRGQNILERGTEMKTGDVILQPGALLGPQDLGVLAAVGRDSVALYAKPRVAVLPTGDEIVDPPAKPGPGQIRNSNGPMLLAQVARAGGLPQPLGIARDSVESLRHLIGEGLRNSDVLILSGGVSAGKLDLVPGVLQELGVKSHFHKISLKPGKPLFFGTLNSKLVFGLPGNPVSSFVCFELFIRPALRKMLGHSDPGPRRTQLPIAAAFASENDRPTYWPAVVEAVDALWRVRPLPWFGSADLRALLTANALLEIPPGPQQFATGQSVAVILLE
jgi:molybdopterin molybdotransferase